jgi:hypothetical protein
MQNFEQFLATGPGYVLLTKPFLGTGVCSRTFFANSERSAPFCVIALILAGASLPLFSRCAYLVIISH